jgi:hypothetical protein
MTPANARRLADALRKMEGDLLDFAVDELGLDDAGLVILDRWFQGQVSRLAIEYLDIGLALAELDAGGS